MTKENRPNLEAIKNWFYTAKVHYISDVPSHYYDALNSIGLVETFDEAYLRNVAIDEALYILDKAAQIAQKRLKDLLDAPKNTLYWRVTCDKLESEINKQKSLRNAFAVFKIRGEFAPEISAIYGTLIQRAAVFYSKPLDTISDLSKL